MNMEKIYDVLDLFGASASVARDFSNAGYNTIGYDIKLDKTHDITSKHGFLELLRMGMA